MSSAATRARRGPKPNLHTRDNLIRTGMRMLHEAGYGATGIKDIVDEAQVPKWSFYNYFQSKEAFGKEVVDSSFGGSLDEVRTRLCDSRVPPLRRLRNYFDDRI